MAVINKNKEKTLFLELLKSNKRGIVKFYMDKCPACIAMANEWKLFKKKMLKINPALPILSIERSVLEKVNFPAKKYINGFPTIFVILPGGEKGPEFNEPRTVEHLIQFAKYIGKKYKINKIKKRRKTKKRRKIKGGQSDTGGHMRPPLPTPPPPPPSPEPSPEHLPKPSPEPLPTPDKNVGKGTGDSKEIQEETSLQSIRKRSNDTFNKVTMRVGNIINTIKTTLGFSGGKKSKKHKRTKKGTKKHKRRTKRKTKRR